MRFKYKYEHLHCGFCADIENGGCPHALCPYILENISDLLWDPDFQEALENADTCDSYHRPTLLLMKRQQERVREKTIPDLAPPIVARHDYKPDCASCSLGGTGFICYSEHDGSCLKTDCDAAIARDKTPCRV